MTIFFISVKSHNQPFFKTTSYHIHILTVLAIKTHTCRQIEFYQIFIYSLTCNIILIFFRKKRSFIHKSNTFTLGSIQFALDENVLACWEEIADFNHSSDQLFSTDHFNRLKSKQFIFKHLKKPIRFHFVFCQECEHL